MSISVNDKAPPRDTTRPNVETMAKGFKNLQWALNLMGYPGLRKGQDRIIHNIFACRDTLGLLPTGTGKTATFVIPTLCLEWRTVIFSPLIALMKDQVQSLCRRGLQADFISSAHTDAENAMVIRRWMAGDLQFLYAAPERLNNDQFLTAIQAVKPDFVVVDEAHTIAQWVDNFRPAYAKIGPFIGRFAPKVVLALTATATPSVETEVREVIGLTGAARIAFLPPRKNLHVQSRIYTGSPWDLLNDINSHDGSTIVYCATVKKVEEMAEQLSKHIKGGSLFYHGQMTPNNRDSHQDMFMSGAARVMFATNAFGMGVDKSDIRMVIHRDIAASVEAITQEQGRAGRDGLDSQCIAYEDKESYQTHRFFIDCGFPPESKVRMVHRFLKGAADREGKLQLTGKEISEQSGVASMMVDSIMAILSRSGVIERITIAEKIASCRLLLATASDPRYLKYASAVEKVGVPNDKGFYEFDMELLANEIGVSAETVRSNLRRLAADNMVTFVPPSRGTPLKIAGPIEQVDFARLAVKASEAHAKLEEVAKYMKVPDQEKHEFVRNYFGIDAKDI